MKVIEKTDVVLNLENIYNDILSIEISMDDSFRTSLDKFYNVMRKWGICQGTWTENGRTVCTAEWNMCWQVFKVQKLQILDIFLVLNDPPEDLLAYGKNPTKKTLKKNETH